MATVTATTPAGCGFTRTLTSVGVALSTVAWLSPNLTLTGHVTLKPHVTLVFARSLPRNVTCVVANVNPVGGSTLVITGAATAVDAERASARISRFMDVTVARRRDD